MDSRIASPPMFRGTSIAVGVLLLGAFVTYGGGTALVNSVLTGGDAASKVATGDIALRAGAVLMLTDAFFVAVIGVLMYVVVRGISERVAVGYLSTRIFEAVALAVGVVFVLLPVPLAGQEIRDAATMASVAEQGNGIAYRVGMMALGLGSVPFWYLAYRIRLVPGPLAAFGVAGYAIFFGGYALDLLGLDVGLLAAIPGGIFEVAVALWLIVKGFSAPVVDVEPEAATAALAPSG